MGDVIEFPKRPTGVRNAGGLEAPRSPYIYKLYRKAGALSIWRQRKGAAEYAVLGSQEFVTGDGLNRWLEDVFGDEEDLARRETPVVRTDDFGEIIIFLLRSENSVDRENARLLMAEAGLDESLYKSALAALAQEEAEGLEEKSTSSRGEHSGRSSDAFFARGYQVILMVTIFFAASLSAIYLLPEYQQIIAAGSLLFFFFGGLEKLVKMLP